MAGIGVTGVADCPICLGTFKDPRFLPCGHTFCLVCIKEHGRSKGSEPDCPNCRAKFHIPSNGLESLPKNYCLTQVLDEFSSIVDISNTRVMKRLCKKHSGEELVLFCVECSLAICLDCMEEDHQKHDFCRISGFAKKARTQLENYIKGIEPILSQVRNQKSMFEEESKKYISLVDKSVLAINQECNNIIQLVNSRRRKLLEELSCEKEIVTGDLRMKIDEIEREQLKLTSFNNQIEEMLQGTDEATTFDMVFQYGDFKERYGQVMQKPLEIMESVTTAGIEFIPGDLKNFISREENCIGRLRMESYCTEHRTTSQVSVPKDLAGVIIGKGGRNIRQVRIETKAEVRLNYPPGDTDYCIITITGTTSQIQYAQYLLQLSVKQHMSRNPAMTSLS